MGELIKFEQPTRRESKVFPPHVQLNLMLANAVDRELRKHGCKVLHADVDGIRPILLVETDTPLHLVRIGRCGLALMPTPGKFVRCRTLLLGCQIEWAVREMLGSGGKR